MPYHMATFSATLAPGIAQQLCPANISRYALEIQVTGTGSVTIGFGAAPSAPGMGLCFDGASTANGQGGSRFWGMPSNDPHFDHYYEVKDVAGDAVPSQSIWGLSAAGSKVVVVENLP